MTLWESFRIALRALGRNKMRTALTMLGVIIGVGAVISLVALGTGAERRVTESISALGTNQINIFPSTPRIRFGGPFTGFTPVTTLTEEDARAIATHFPQTVAGVAPTARGQVTAKLGDKTYQTSAVGTTPDYRNVNKASVKLGRFISAAEVDGRVKVAVLGPTVVEQLLGSPEADPVGMIVQLNRLSFKVIGVLKSKGSGTFGQDQDDMVIIPVSTALRRVFNRTYLSNLSVEASSKETIDLATEQISRLLRQRHHLQPPFPDNDDFTVRSQTSLLETFTTMTATMTSLLAGIAVVSLVVGGIGIMNIMLVSVTERTREIGLRKAVGATSRDILLQFLIESCVVAAVGGMFGILVGALGSKVLGKILQTPSAVTLQSVIEAVVVSTAIGLFFGIYPAQKASRLNPIEALRYE